MTTEAAVLSNILPNVPEFEFLAVSDGESVMLTLIQRDNQKLLTKDFSIGEIQLSEEDVRMLLSLIEGDDER